MFEDTCDMDYRTYVVHATNLFPVLSWYAILFVQASKITSFFKMILLNTIQINFVTFKVISVTRRGTHNFDHVNH